MIIIIVCIDHSHHRSIAFIIGVHVYDHHCIDYHVCSHAYDRITIVIALAHAWPRTVIILKAHLELRLKKQRQKQEQEQRQEQEQEQRANTRKNKS